MRNLGRVSALVLVGVASAALAACDNGQRPDGSSNADAPLAGAVTGAAGDPTGGQGGGRTGRTCTVEDVQVSGPPDGKPTVALPKDCAPPAALASEDLDPGTGAAAKNGDPVTTNYTLYTWSDGAMVESSYDAGQPYTVQQVGAHQVIAGWDQGLLGVKQGMRRLLIIPPQLAYGATGNQGIKPNETLVFVIDVVKVGS